MERGGDIASIDNSSVVYKYPYKSQQLIRLQLRSARYKAWLENSKITTVINTKSYLHSYPVFEEKTARYLVRGDQVQVIDQTSGWVEVLFKNKESKVFKGWIPCGNTYGCGLP